MKVATAMRHLQIAQGELALLRGPCDRTTAAGRVRHNRKSTLYRKIKRIRANIRGKIRGAA